MNKKWMMIVIATVVLLGGGGAAAFFLIGDSSGADGGTAAHHGPAGLVTLEPFLVNINDGAGERFAKLDLSLTIVPSSQASKLGEDPLAIAKVRDRILTILTAKTHKELSTPLGKESFRQELKNGLAPLIAGGEIDEVLFQDFVVQ